MSGLSLRNVSKSFDKTVVLDDITLEVGPSELMVLLGPSGCGKSTVLRLISGLEEVDRGEIFIGSHRVDRLRPRDRDVSLVFQNYSLYPHMTVAKNLAFPLKVARVGKEEIERRVREVSDMLGLGDRLKARPGELSGGQRQRVALGRAIIREPSVFLLDEPLSNLDADLRARMRKEIVQLQRRLGKPMIHVTHDQTEALTMADRVALLNNGKIEQLGSPEELYRRPCSRFVAEFIGAPKINMIEGTLEENRVIPFGSILPREIRVQLNSDHILIGVRPEAIEICNHGEYTATVKLCEYLGDHYVATLDFQGQTLVSSHLPELPPPTGQTVRFALDKEAILFFDATNGKALSVM
jgi:ABC-type sugar transport system ATPase subunit